MSPHHMLFTTDPLIGRHYVSIIEFQGETFSKRSGDRNYRLTAARTKAVRKAHVLIHLDTCTCYAQVKMRRYGWLIVSLLGECREQIAEQSNRKMKRPPSRLHSYMQIRMRHRYRGTFENLVVPSFECMRLCVRAPDW